MQKSNLKRGTHTEDRATCICVKFYSSVQSIRTIGLDAFKALSWAKVIRPANSESLEVYSDLEEVGVFCTVDSHIWNLRLQQLNVFAIPYRQGWQLF